MVKGGSSWTVFEIKKHGSGHSMKVEIQSDPKLSATILKALREQLKENDQLNVVEDIAGPEPEIPLEYDQLLKGGGEFWDDVNGGYLPEDLVLAARREESDCWVHSDGVFQIVPMRECKAQA